jgi:hypothetical protein
VNELKYFLHCFDFEKEGHLFLASIDYVPDRLKAWDRPDIYPISYLIIIGQTKTRSSLNVLRPGAI